MTIRCNDSESFDFGKLPCLDMGPLPVDFIADLHKLPAFELELELEPLDLELEPLDLELEPLCSSLRPD